MYASTIIQPVFPLQQGVQAPAVVTDTHLGQFAQALA